MEISAALWALWLGKDFIRFSLRIKADYAPSTVEFMSVSKR